MRIDIRDPELEARIERQLRSSGGSVEQVLLRLLDTQEEQDRWLAEHRHEISEKISTGIAQLDRGEGIPDHQVRAHVERLKRRRQ